MKDFYNQLNNWIINLEHGKPSPSIDAIASKLEWCWKFRKITQSQKDELADKIIALLENN